MNKPRYRYNHKSKSWDELFKIDTRIHEIQTREIREGVAMLFQGRTVIHNHDGTQEIGEWKTNITADNYGLCFDDKPTLMQRLINWI